MSYITNIIITTAIEDTGMEELNTALATARDGERFAQVDMYAGGYKAIEADIFMAAFNYLHFRDFRLWVKKVKWQHPEQLAIFIKGQNDKRFTRFETVALLK